MNAEILWALWSTRSQAATKLRTGIGWGSILPQQQGSLTALLLIRPHAAACQRRQSHPRSPLFLGLLTQVYWRSTINWDHADQSVGNTDRYVVRTD